MRWVEDLRPKYLSSSNKRILKKKKNAFEYNE